MNMNARKEITEAAKSAKSAFTLVELLVVVAIIGTLSAGAVIGVPRILENSRRTAAQSQLQTLRTAIDQYNMDTKKYPETLAVLVEGEKPYIEGGQDSLVDPWGNDYIYKKEGKKKFEIRSCGPDEEPNTEDDLIQGNISKK
jgi:general secretion pathway protein G